MMISSLRSIRASFTLSTSVVLAFMCRLHQVLFTSMAFQHGTPQYFAILYESATISFNRCQIFKVKSEKEGENSVNNVSKRHAARILKKSLVSVRFLLSKDPDGNHRSRLSPYHKCFLQGRTSAMPTYINAVTFDKSLEKAKLPGILIQQLIKKTKLPGL